MEGNLAKPGGYIRKLNLYRICKKW